MKYYHTLDTDEIQDREEEQNDYWETLAELMAEDAAMEKYYEEKYNQ